MKKFVVLLLVFLLMLCGCGTTATLKVSGELLSGEYEISSFNDKSDLDRIVDRIIFFSDGKCYLHSYAGNFSMNYSSYYSYDEDSSYIMFSSSADAFIGLARVEGNQIVFEQLNNEEKNFALERKDEY